MKVLFAAPEIPPYAKVGGLGDVVGALSKALSGLGVDARLFCPLYGGIVPAADWRAHPAPIPVNLGGASCHGRLWEAEHPESGVPVAFLEYNDYFGREGVYGPSDNGHAFGDNGQRFAFFSRAAIEYCHHVNWLPDVVHCHDWTTGLLPALIAEDHRQPGWSPATVLTLHNMEHQGVFGAEVAAFAGIASAGVQPAPVLNFLGEGIAKATVLTTVSPTYAREIQQAPGGWGLEALLNRRAKDLHGILNGIDLDAWNPATDPALPQNFSTGDFTGKATAKSVLQNEMGLPADASAPVFGVVSRLYAQKGLDMLAQCLPQLLASNGKAQFVILGSGEPAQEEAFQALSRIHTGQIAVATRFDEGLARRIYGGSDFFVMPSRFEPCGLGQLYAMRYGSIPVVRTTGGLADTVRPASSEDGTGILFDEPTATELKGALLSALELYADTAALRVIRQNAMQADFSWDAPARQYLALYRSATGAES